MTDRRQPTLARLAAELDAGKVTSRSLVTECLARIASPTGEGARTFLRVHAEQALLAADFYDELRKRRALPGPYAGIPVSVKDIFDMAGDTTTAGSVVLRSAPPATRDAVAVGRLKAAGFVVMGRTNMTEFAYSGLGLNPHYGSPRNPWDRTTGRIPGGSSSGAAISITDSMAFGALGTDTGGSCRIPAALCGIVGFKPTARRIPRDGTFPLSDSLDSIGPMARSVACCAALDSILAGGVTSAGELPAPSDVPGRSVRDLRLGVLTSYVVDGLDPRVAAAFDRALRVLAQAGATLIDLDLVELKELPDINSTGGLSAPEAFAVHRERLASSASLYDPRVSSRILRGREQDAADYIEVHAKRASFIERATSRIANLDAVLMPTTPIVAPTFAELESDEAYVRINALVLRNPSVVNFLDGCALSLPCHEPDCVPVGLTLFAGANRDRPLLSAAAALERCLATST